MVRFYRKFLSRRYAWPLNLLVVIGVWLRFLGVAPLEWLAYLRRPQPTLPVGLPRPVAEPPPLPCLPGWVDQPVLVTGGTGFIGSRLVDELLRQGAEVRVLSRSAQSVAQRWPDGRVRCVSGDLTRPDSLKDCCDGSRILFHLASCAHMLDDAESGGLRHQQVTEQGTAELLQVARRAGVRCLVFVSSIKAMGEGGEGCQDERCEARPETAYGVAKRHAEELVLDAGRGGELRTCVLRLPMVYGPGNKGNLPRMIEAIRAGRFPPLPEVGNRRSMVHVDDTIQAMLLAAVNPAAAGQVYIVTDGEAYSTAGIYRLIATHLGRRPPRWTLPLGLLRLAAAIGDQIARVGLKAPLRSDTLRKLLGSAWYSSDKIHRELGYTPRYDLPRALPDMVAELDGLAPVYGGASLIRRPCRLDAEEKAPLSAPEGGLALGEPQPHWDAQQHASEGGQQYPQGGGRHCG